MEVRDFILFVKKFVEDNTLLDNSPRDETNPYSVRFAVDKFGKPTSLSLNTTNKTSANIIEEDRLAVAFTFEGMFSRCIDLVGPKENKNDTLYNGFLEYHGFAKDELYNGLTESNTFRQDKYPPLWNSSDTSKVIAYNAGKSKKEILLDELNRAVEIHDAMEKFKPLWKQKLAEVKNKDDKHFVIQSSTLDKYGLNRWGCVYMAKNIALLASLKLKIVNGDWDFDKFKED